MPRIRAFRCEDCGQPFPSRHYKKPGRRTCLSCGKARMIAVCDLQRSPEFRELLRQRMQRTTTEA